jgi:heptosyltransferase-2
MHKKSAREVRRLVRNDASANRTAWPANAHHIYQYLHLVAQLGANPEPIRPQIQVTEAEVQAALDRFEIVEDPARLILGLNAGAEYGPAKRWPVESFVAAARELSVRTRCRWFIFGGETDRELADQIESGIAQDRSSSQEQGKSVINLAGRTTLRELCVLLKACRVVLTNDTGPMHVAAAVGTRVVVPFGSTSPELTGPGLPGDPQHRLLQAQVACSPCFLRCCPIDLRCMGSLGVRQVVEATEALLKT